MERKSEPQIETMPRWTTGIALQVAGGMRDARELARNLDISAEEIDAALKHPDFHRVLLRFSSWGSEPPPPDAMDELTAEIEHAVKAAQALARGEVSAPRPLRSMRRAPRKRPVTRRQKPWNR